jgi:hypothetical protein
MKYVDELSTMSVRAKLTRSPSTLRYRIVDVDNSRTVLDWTSIAPSDDVTFTVAASVNAIYQDSRGKKRKTEKRVLVMQADAGTDGQVSKEEEYVVRNLKGFEST